MTKGTIIRTIMLLLVLINMVLKGIGKPVIDIAENEVASFIETLIELAVIIVAWWKNNSFSKHAIMVDTILHKLQAGMPIDDREE